MNTYPQIDLSAWKQVGEGGNGAAYVNDAEPGVLLKVNTLDMNVRQQKTDAKVAISCNSALKAILEKYDYQVPHLADQVINRYIKEIALAAGLTELVEEGKD